MKTNIRMIFGVRRIISKSTAPSSLVRCRRDRTFEPLTVVMVVIVVARTPRAIRRAMSATVSSTSTATAMCCQSIEPVSVPQQRCLAATARKLSDATRRPTIFSATTAKAHRCACSTNRTHMHKAPRQPLLLQRRQYRLCRVTTRLQRRVG